VPPPSHINSCHFHASAFFRGVLFDFGSVSAATAAFITVLLFNRALILFRLRETPNDPIVRLPFFDFLSPLPIDFANCGGNNNKQRSNNKLSDFFDVTFKQTKCLRV
jgi:hypothetical protein